MASPSSLTAGLRGTVRFVSRRLGGKHSGIVSSPARQPQFACPFHRPGIGAFHRTMASAASSSAEQKRAEQETLIERSSTPSSEWVELTGNEAAAATNERLHGGFDAANGASLSQEQPLQQPLKVESEKAEELLFSLRVRFARADGTPTTLSAVYQDTMPSGSSVGTAVMMHGSPGSHADFKYVYPFLTAAGIRAIGVNFPGFGFTEDDDALQHVNVERIGFVESLVEALGLRGRSPAIFVGHSRGTENALMLGARNQDLAVGVVMVNPTGLRIHRGTKPHSFFVAVSWFLRNIPVARGLVQWFIAKLYARVGLRIKNGPVAEVAIHTMRSLALHRQEEFMHRLQESGRSRLLFAYSGDDWIIEPEVSQEFEAKIQDRVHLECKTDDDAEEAAITKEMVESFASGRRAVAAYFHTDNHFLQKHRAAFLAQGIESIFKAAPTEKENK